MISDIIKNWACFVDGRGYAGEASEFNPPDLTLTTENVRNGGMDAPVAVDMGQELLTTSFSLTKYAAEVIKLWGLAAGSAVPLILRGAKESRDGTVTPIIITMQGQVTTLARGTWTPGQMALLQVTMNLHYYKEEHDNQTLVEVDLLNMTRIIDGVDQLKAQRDALGI